MDFVGNDGASETFDYMNVLRNDDSVTVTQVEKEIKTQLEQSAGEVAARIMGNVAGTYVKQIDDLANAVSSGSPGAIATQVFKAAVKYVPYLTNHRKRITDHSLLQV
jgi:hypothetical protein